MPVAIDERAGAVEVDRDLDVGFLGLALDRGLAHGASLSNSRALYQGIAAFATCQPSRRMREVMRGISTFRAFDGPFAPTARSLGMTALARVDSAFATTADALHVLSTAGFARMHPTHTPISGTAPPS